MLTSTPIEALHTPSIERGFYTEHRAFISRLPSTL